MAFPLNDCLLLYTFPHIITLWHGLHVVHIKLHRKCGSNYPSDHLGSLLFFSIFIAFAFQSCGYGEMLADVYYINTPFKSKTRESEFRMLLDQSPPSCYLILVLQHARSSRNITNVFSFLPQPREHRNFMSLLH